MYSDWPTPPVWAVLAALVAGGGVLVLVGYLAHVGSTAAAVLFAAGALWGAWLSRMQAREARRRRWH